MLLVILLILSGLLYFYLKQKLNYWKIRNVPHKKPNLIFGNLLTIASGSESPAKCVEDLYKEFNGPYFGFYAFTKPWLVVKDPDVIRQILIKENNSFPNRLVASDEKIDSMVSNNLFGIKAPKWKLLRSKLSPVFSSGKIKGMLYLMVDCGENLIKYINAHVNKGLEVKEVAAKYTTDVISSCAFGIAANSFVFENSDFRIAGRKLFQRSFFKSMTSLCYFFAPMLVKIFRFKFVDEDAVHFLRKVFNETIKEREKSKTKRNDLIDILIELKNDESSDDNFKFYGDRLVAQAVGFFGAGQETTSSVIAFTLHELCVNPTIQTRLRKEINEVINKYGVLSYEAVQDMTYLHMIICESLRKYPLTPFLIRHCEENYTIPETGLTIEKGTAVLISQGGLHKDPKYFPNPQLYDPERFNRENKEQIAKYVYLPFGDGPRNCIGERFGLLSTKLGIIQIIRNFSVERSAETREPLVFGRSPLLLAEPGVFVQFKKLSEK